MDNESAAEDIIKRRAIFYRSFGIYAEVGGFYDYGPIGLKIKRNVEAAWRRVFTEGLGLLEVETSIVLPEVVLKASGHLATFTDPVGVCASCHTSYRLDKLLEEYYEARGDDESLSGVKKLKLNDLAARIASVGIKCTKCGGKIGDPENFNLMFKTQIGQKAAEVAYLRPETAQGIFVDFKDIYRAYGLRLPCGISQVGKAFRNEISPRQQLVRVREFTQMETEIFIDKDAKFVGFGGVDFSKVENEGLAFIRRGEESESEHTIKDLLAEGAIPNEYFAILLYKEKELIEQLGIEKGRHRFRQLEKEELPHYSMGNIDLEIKTSYGYIEVAGNAHRRDYDLSSHSKMSGSDLSVLSSEKKVLPHVIEASMGVDRLLFSIMDGAVRDDNRGWKFLALKSCVAPYVCAVFPLQKDEALIGKAREIRAALEARHVPSFYAEAGSIGKRYARADEIGVPNAITIDFDTLKDNTVTIRDRDTSKQVRKSVAEMLELVV
jgi:glycyl-tRNA synthetase